MDDARAAWLEQVRPGVWVRIVAHCRADAGVTDFDALLAAYPWLLDKRALLKHYSSRTLASEQARREWVDGDVLAVPSG